MQNTQKQPSESKTPPNVAKLEDKPQESEVSVKENPKNQQPEETAE